MTAAAVVPVASDAVDSIGEGHPINAVAFELRRAPGVSGALAAVVLFRDGSLWLAAPMIPGNPDAARWRPLAPARPRRPATTYGHSADAEAGRSPIGNALHAPPYDPPDDLFDPTDDGPPPGFGDELPFDGDPLLDAARGALDLEHVESQERAALATATAGATGTVDDPRCPLCAGRMWDNRTTKRNPKAPDFKCRDRQCDGVIWPGRDRA